MNRWELRRILEERILLLDGAYGTEFIKTGLKGGIPSEILNVEKPEMVLDLQKRYVMAGADILITNTFGAIPMKLAKHGLEGLFEDIVRNAIRIARKASRGKTLVFGNLGPSGELPEPMGNGNFDIFYENFRKVVEIMLEEGVDGFILETFSDILELKAAVYAVRDLSEDVFVIAHLTFDERGRTLTGTDPKNFALTFEDLDVDALGMNCTLGPEEMLPVFQELSKYTSKYLSVEPNAGMPQIVDGKTIYPVGPEEFAAYVDSFWESGVNILGGCCGTTPKHISLLKRTLGRRAPVERTPKKVFAVTSPSNLVDFEDFVVVGERINPAGRKKLWKAMLNEDMTVVEKEAKEQVENGARILDVNFGVERSISSNFAKIVVERLPYTSAPLSLDVQGVDLIEELMKVYPGRPLLNSSRAVHDEIEERVRILKKYGGILVILAMEEHVPRDFDDRKKAIEKALRILEDLCFDTNRIIIDPVVLPLGAGGKAVDVLKTIEYVKNLGFKTILGLSNISFGLPDRSSYNAAFLVMAIERGLNSAIMNPLDDALMKIMEASLVILGKKEPPKKNVKTDNEILDIILSGKTERLLEIVKNMVDNGTNPMDVVEKHLRPAMEEVGRLYDKGKIFLPQLIVASQTAVPSFEFLESKMVGQGGDKAFVIATVRGDIHDIGKNIVASVVKSSGYKVIDLGKDVPNEKIVEAVERYKPVALGLSAMMTTTVLRIREIVEELKRRNLRVPVIVGGASLNENLSKELGADFYARSATDVVRFLKEIERRERN
ncbi:MAG: homocysteine S-methyltransferase family protein [Thermotogaceae bacterium]|nr:homocysteine S-methyltransferase family protein [Thermotogaceae bacterium]